MDIAMIGLGRMGANMARRLIKAGHKVFGYDRTTEETNCLAAEANLIPAYSLDELLGLVKPPRVIWMMLPAGDATEITIQFLGDRLSAGDIVIDGGNSFYRDSIRRAKQLKETGIEMLDCGTSGGIWGLTEGYSLMIGGDTKAVERLRPIFESLAPAVNKGWGGVGPSGAGHFTKMIHNGIEYGMMQAFAEGFEIMHSKSEFSLDLHQVSQIWQHGSVVRSWLLDLIVNALEGDNELSEIRGWVADSGEGRWTVFESIDLEVPAPVISLALQMRLVSRQDDSYAAKLLAALRNQFGGHPVKQV